MLAASSSTTFSKSSNEHCCYYSYTIPAAMGCPHVAGSIEQRFLLQTGEMLSISFRSELTFWQSHENSSHMKLFLCFSVTIDAANVYILKCKSSASFVFKALVDLGFNIPESGWSELSWICCVYLQGKGSQGQFISPYEVLVLFLQCKMEVSLFGSRTKTNFPIWLVLGQSGESNTLCKVWKLN